MIKRRKRGVCVIQDLHRTFLFSYRLHQEITFAINGSEALLFDFEQPICDLSDYAAITEIMGKYPQITA